MGTKLDWHVLKSYIGPFLMSFLIILFILVMQFMSLYRNDIFGKGIDGWILLKLFFFAAGRMSLLALPVAILAGALMTFGSMGEHYELAAIKSSGISLFRLMRSSLLFAIILTGYSLWFSFSVIPEANVKFFSLLYDIRQKKPDVAIQPGHFYSDIDGYIIRVSDKDNDSGILYDVKIYDHSQNRGAVDVILADSARTSLEADGRIMQMTLYSGVRHEEFKETPDKAFDYPYGRTYFDSLYYKFNLSGFDLGSTDESLFKHQITFTRSQLQVARDSLDEKLIDSKQKYFNQLARYTQIDSQMLGQPVAPPRPKSRPKVDSSKTRVASIADSTKSVTYTPDTTQPEPTVAYSPPVVKPWPSYDEVFEYDDGVEHLVDCFPDTRMSIISQALVDARSVKNYVDFMIKKKEDEDTVSRKYHYEFHNRHALPLNCILFMMIGVSLGAIIRKGGLGPPALVSITFFLAFYVLTTQAKKLSNEGVLEPWLGAWFPIFIFTPIAIILAYQATTDSSLLDESAWDMRKDAVRNVFLVIRNKFSKPKNPPLKPVK